MDWVLYVLVVLGGIFWLLYVVSKCISDHYTLKVLLEPTKRKIEREKQQEV